MGWGHLHVILILVQKSLSAWWRNKRISDGNGKGFAQRVADHEDLLARHKELTKR